MISDTLSEIYKMLYDAFGPQHWWPGETSFEIMAGAILTQNTSWTNVEKAIANLKSAGNLTPEALHRIDLAAGDFDHPGRQIGAENLQAGPGDRPAAQPQEITLADCVVDRVELLALQHDV